MRQWQTLLLAVALVPLAACGTANSSSNATVNQGTGPTAASAPTAAQQLPLLASVTIGGKLIRLEVARTPVQLETGLMFRTELPADRDVHGKTTGESRVLDEGHLDPARHHLPAWRCR